MPTLRSHTHLQAAQAKTQIQSLQKSMPAQTHGRQNRCSKNERNITRKMNNETLTSCISNGGVCSVFERSAPHQVRCNLTGKSPAIPNDFIPPTVSHNNRETIKQIEEIKLTLYKFKKYDYVL